MTARSLSSSQGGGGGGIAGTVFKSFSEIKATDLQVQDLVIIVQQTHPGADIIAHALLPLTFGENDPYSAPCRASLTISVLEVQSCSSRRITACTSKCH